MINEENGILDMRIGWPADKHLPKCFRIHLLGDAWATMTIPDENRKNWTLPEALAWIIFRNETKVDEALINNLSVMAVLEEAIKAPASKKDKEKTTTNSNSKIEDNSASDAKIEAEENATHIRDDFVRKLESGKLEAQGYHPGENRPQLIQASAWRSIDSLHEFIGALPAHAVGQWDSQRRAGVIIYRRVFVLKNDVLRLWPVEKNYPKNKRNYPEAKVREFLTEKIQATGRDMSQKTAVEIVQAEFPGHPRDPIRNLCKLLTGNDKKGPRGPRIIEQK